jgi:UrcA family protein
MTFRYRTPLTPAPAAALAAALCVALATPAAAQDKPDAQTHAITLHGVNTHPATIRAARKTLARIGDAAFVVCGAPDSSLHDVKMAVRASTCWHESMIKTLARINDPLLNRAAADQGL